MQHLHRPGKGRKFDLHDLVIMQSLHNIHTFVLYSVHYDCAVHTHTLCTLQDPSNHCKLAAIDFTIPAGPGGHAMRALILLAVPLQVCHPLIVYPLHREE